MLNRNRFILLLAASLMLAGGETFAAKCPSGLVPIAAKSPVLRPDNPEGPMAGVVTLRAVVLPSGKLMRVGVVSTRLRLLGSEYADPAAYVNAALVAARSWTYPARRKPCSLTLTIKYVNASSAR